MTDSNNSFVRGICVGIAGTATLIHVWLGLELMNMRYVYEGFAATVPTITVVVISPLWLWGIPALGAVAVSALIRRRPRILVHVLVAALLVLLAIVTWHWSRAPLTAVNLR